MEEKASLWRKIIRQIQVRLWKAQPMLMAINGRVFSPSHRWQTAQPRLVVPTLALPLPILLSLRVIAPSLCHRRLELQVNVTISLSHASRAFLRTSAERIWQDYLPLFSWSVELNFPGKHPWDRWRNKNAARPYLLFSLVIGSQPWQCIWRKKWEVGLY